MRWRDDILIEDREQILSRSLYARRGWQRLRLRLRSHDRHGLRKRLRIRFLNDGRVLHQEEFAWNESLNEAVVFQLPDTATAMELCFLHAHGRQEVRQLSLHRVSSLRATAKAISCKLKLLSQFNCLKPVLARGTKLLLRGEFRAVAGKIWKGLPDSRTMNLESRRAEEAGAAWWRRRSLTQSQREQFQNEADAIEHPVPVAVIIPVDATRVDHARQAVFSVLRQIYPHWQLRVLWPGEEPPAELTAAIRRDSRANMVKADTLEDAYRRALASVPCERMLVLSPDAELSDEALLKMHDQPESLRLNQCGVYGELKLFAGVDCRFPTAMSVLRQLQSLVPHTVEDHAFPLDAGHKTTAPLFSPVPATKSLHVAANITGISGWDALAFQMLRGLSRSGVRCLRHPDALVKTHTLPPGMSFEETPRTANDPQLIIAAPFQVKPFAPDARTAVFTMWECDRLPAESVKELNKARVVIVPTQWGKTSFRESGVTVPIEVVPLGIDPLLFHPNVKNNQQCVFGTAGALGAGGIRKNLNMVMTAFQRAFAGIDDVVLRIKITPNCPPLDVDDARIEITRAVLPANEVANWNRSLTAYVNASMAEGFGLHLLESMACGVPLISTTASGVGEYFDNQVGCVISHQDRSVRNEYYNGTWYEPDLHEMIAAMRSVYDNRNHALLLGQAAACRARGYTWRDTGRQLIQALKNHEVIR